MTALDARALANRHLTCDFCGVVPPMLFLPEKYAGVFCKACVGDVVKPAPVKLASDEEAGYVDIGRKFLIEDRLRCCTGAGARTEVGWQPLGKYLRQTPQLHRLGQIIVHPFTQASIPVARHRIRRHGDDGDIRSHRRANGASGLVAVHHGHLAIHQYQVVPALL